MLFGFYGDKTTATVTDYIYICVCVQVAMEEERSKATECVYGFRQESDDDRRETAVVAAGRAPQGQVVVGVLSRSRDRDYVIE